MHASTKWALSFLAMLMLGCASGTRGGATAADHVTDATLAQVYFWRARPGMTAEYNRYIRDVAEPIDDEAQRAGAFVSVTTYAASDTTLSYTHMRIFLLRDSTQLRGLGAALSAAGARLEPDTAARRRQGEYSATLRDRVGSAVMEIVK